MTLNRAQQQAVTSTASTIVVIAGPGSGKTRVIEQRIRHRITEGTDPRKIVVLTFTQAGAFELRQRLDIQLGYIGTLHGWCFGLMQKHGQHIGYRAGGITIVPEEAKEQMVKEIMARLQVKIPWIRMTETPLKSDAKLVWDEYRHVLKRNNLVDYDGILKEGYRILSLITPDVHELYVDEAQDSGPDDWNIYLLLPCSKFIVGDPDQSIYAFRGGHPEILTKFAKAEHVELILLEQNYRSDVKICEAANCLISNNENRVKKEIKPVSTEAGAVGQYHYHDDRDENSMVASAAQQVFSQGQSVAILCRTNYQAQQIRLILPRCAGDQRMPHDWNKALLVVSLLVHTNDVLVERYLRLQHSASEVTAIKLKVQAQGSTLTAIAQNSISALKAGCDKPADVPKALAFAHVGEEAVNLIRDRIALLPENATLADLLSDLYSPVEAKEAGNQIFCSTIHASKGREWDTVFITGCEEGLLPFHKAELEEERRLFFVGITRARHRLVLSSCSLRQRQFGGPVQQSPSRFLTEVEF